MKTLLSVVHGGYLWLDPPVSIDAELIHQIMGLPLVGEDLRSFFGDKKSDKALAAKVSGDYNLERGHQGLIFEGLQDPAVRFGAQILAGKLLRHQGPDEGNAGCIIAATKCVEGVLMSWAHFLVEKFRLDFLAA